MAANHISKDKIVGSFFNRANRRADISGNVPSDHFVTSKGRKGRRTAEKVKIKDDAQFSGRCYEFDSNRYLYVDNVNRGATSVSVAEMMNNRSWSISFNIKTTTTSSLQDIMCNNQGSNENLYLTIRDGKIVATMNHASQAARCTSSKLINDGVWYQVILEYDYASKSFRVYVDGIETSYDEAQSGIGDPIHNTTRGEVWYFGRFGDNSEVSRCFEGRLYGIRFFDRLVYGEDVMDYTIPSIMTLTGEESNAFALYDLNENIRLTAISDTTMIEDVEVSHSWLNQKGYNSAAYFDGTSYIDCGNDEALRITGDISFGAWINTSNPEGAILSKYQFETSNKRAWQMRVSSGLLGVYISDNGTLGASNHKFYRSDININDRWVLVTATFKADTSSLTLYVDGQEILAPETSGNGSITSIIDVDHPVYIGAIDNGAPVTFFDGEMFNAFIYDRELTHVEINDIYHHTIPQDFVLYTEFESSRDSFIDHANQEMTNSGVQPTVMPAALGNTDEDINSFPLKYKGKLAPRLQLVNAPCVSLNGIDQRVELSNANGTGGTDKTFLVKIKVDASEGDYTPLCGGDLSVIRWLPNSTQIGVRGHSNAATTVVDFPSSIRTYDWHNVIVFYRGSDSKFKFNINAIENTNGWVSIESGSSFELTQVGYGVSAYLNAEISVIGTWARHLTVKEILDINNELPVNPTVLLSFVEGDGTTIYDVSGTDNHGQITNAILPDVWSTQNVYHYGFYHGFNDWLNFDGQANKIDLNFSRLNCPATILLRIKVNEVTGSDNMYPIISGRADGSPNLFLRVFNGVLEWAFYNGSDTQNRTIGFGTINSHEYLHVAITLENDQCKGFLNGVYFDNSTANWNGVVIDQDNWQLGADSRGQRYWDGLIGEVYFYERILSNQEILDCYNNDYPIDYHKAFVPRDKQLIELVSDQNINVSTSSSFISLPSSDDKLDALGRKVENEGYNNTGLYNGASDIQFPDIPEIPDSLRAKTFNEAELTVTPDKSVYLGYSGDTVSRILVSGENLSFQETQKEGVSNIGYLDKLNITSEGWCFDLYKQYKSYNGPCIRIKRVSDDAETDIYFDANGYVDTQAIIDFCSGSTGLLVRWYNQNPIGVVGAAPYAESNSANVTVHTPAGLTLNANGDFTVYNNSGAISMAFTLRNESKTTRVICKELTQNQISRNASFGLTGNGSKYNWLVYSTAQPTSYSNVIRNNDGFKFPRVDFSDHFALHLFTQIERGVDRQTNVDGQSYSYVQDPSFNQPFTDQWNYLGISGSDAGHLSYHNVNSYIGFFDDIGLEKISLIEKNVMQKYGLL